MKRTAQSDTTASLGSIWFKLKMEDFEHSLATGFENGGMSSIWSYWKELMPVCLYPITQELAQRFDQVGRLV